MARIDSSSDFQLRVAALRKDRSLLEGMIFKHEARRWQTVSNIGERK